MKINSKTMFAAALGAVMSFTAVTATMAAELIVGVSWSNFQEERWKTDEAGIKKGLGSDAKYISSDAGVFEALARVRVDDDRPGRCTLDLADQ